MRGGGFALALLWSGAAAAQDGRVIDLTFTGPVAPEVQALLERALVPQPTLFDPFMVGVGGADAAGLRACVAARAQGCVDFAQDARIFGQAAALPGLGRPAIPFDPGEPGSLEAGMPTIAALGPSAPMLDAIDAQAFAIALEQRREMQGAVHAGLETVAADLASGTFANRVFALPPGLSDADRAALEQELAAAGVGVTVATTANTTLLEGEIMAAAAPAVCAGAAGDGPFPLAEVIAVLDFNRQVFAALRLVPYRSRVLVVDTGIGQGIATSDFLAPFLDFDSEALLQKTTIVTGTNEVACMADRKFLYGAVPDADSFAHDRCLPGAARAALADRGLEPLPPLPGAVERYTPGHGSVVASIAIGGPVLVARYPDLADLLSVRAFRITSPPAPGLPSSFSVLAHSISESAVYAVESRVDIVNMSLKTSQVALIADMKRAGFLDSDDVLLVAAAGNGSNDIAASLNDNLPATLGDHDNVLAVAGLERAGAGWALWGGSSFSTQDVMIAAPAVGIAGLDGAARPVCATGTSAAAPIVAFAAALLRSFGLTEASAIKWRILDAADRDPALADRVQDGRHLNLPRAIDLFSDIVIRRDGTVLRGRLMAREDGMFRVCHRRHFTGQLQKTAGLIDLGVAGRWSRVSDGMAEVIHYYGGRPATETGCALPDEAFGLRLHGSDAVQQIGFAEVETILFSPFRSAEVDWALLRIN